MIWADDLLLLSETESGLNAMLEKLHSYSQENLIKVNIEKTKCMIFNKTGRHVRKLFMFGKSKIETIREYKYLGLLITPSLNLSSIQQLVLGVQLDRKYGYHLALRASIRHTNIP